MRKLLVLLAVVVMAVGLFSPAEAARKKSFSISLKPTPSGTQKSYNDTSLDLTSNNAPINTRTVIRGQVKGGKVKGKKVAIYVTNLHTVAKKRTLLGSAKLDAKGVFTKPFTPSKGHAGLYKIEIVKKAGGGRKGKTKTFNIRVNEFVSLAMFYDAAASGAGVARADKEPVGPKTNERWSISYAVAGGSTAVFDFRGYACSRFNLKIGVSQSSRGDDLTYRVGQPGRTIMSGSKSKGDGFIEPTRTQSENVDPNQLFTVTNTGDADSRMILGLPKAACMHPYKVGAQPLG